MLYDPRDTEKNAHSNLSRLRLKLVNKKDRSLAKPPPCEECFEEYESRAQWQTKVGMSSHVTKPNISHPSSSLWRKSGQLIPLYFKGPIASELLEGLICSCTSRNRCTNNCLCNQNSLCCTELCNVMAMKTVEIHIQLATSTFYVMMTRTTVQHRWI